MSKSFKTMGEDPLTDGFERHLQMSETTQRVFNIILLVSAVTLSLFLVNNCWAWSVIPAVLVVLVSFLSYRDHMGVLNAKMNRDTKQYRVFTGCEKVVDGKSKVVIIEVSSKTENGVLGTEVCICDSYEESTAKLVKICFMVDWYGYISQLYKPESCKSDFTMEDLNDMCRVCFPSV